MGEVGTLSVAVMVWRLRRLWERVGELLALVFAKSRTLIMRAWDLIRVRESIRDSQRTCARSGTFEVSEKVRDFWGIFYG